MLNFFAATFVNNFIEYLRLSCFLIDFFFIWENIYLHKKELRKNTHLKEMKL